ncbi:thiol-activated cytolysin family protein [Sphingobacterium paludis]|uniref:Thiol-activated cytolysin n=1 Tax=Sphingobacterium paludis TaxID=1476465 RepID=A0A4R7CR78_9SPHI|nr:thiol-activated cytolysin family protein [Sphingobacterium paludis]TDS08878.1 thiol-activated cytolysin [Sphingobacterium paludis]
MTIEGYADEFVIIPEWLGRRDVFHLGSLIQGNTLQNLSFTPLSEREGHYESRPIFASVSFPAKTVSGSYLPDIMATTKFFSNIMQENNLSDMQNSTFRYEIKEFSYYNEVKTVFGSNVDVRALFYASNSSATAFSGRIQKTNGLIASFTQTNFTVDMDIPESGELYQNLNLDLLGNVYPAYINSVAYGSKGVLLIESEQDAEVLQTTFNKAFSVMGGLVSGSQSLASDEKNIIQNADLQIFFTGITGESVRRKIGSFDELISLIKTGTHFPHQHRGGRFHLR